MQDAHFIKEGLRDEILEPILSTINPDENFEDPADDDDMNLKKKIVICSMYYYHFVYIFSTSYELIVFANK